MSRNESIVEHTNFTATHKSTSHSPSISSMFKSYLTMRQAVLTFICSILVLGPSFGAELAVPDNVVFKRAIEFSNPDNQHLQVDLAMPKF